MEYFLPLQLTKQLDGISSDFPLDSGKSKEKKKTSCDQIKIIMLFNLIIIIVIPRLKSEHSFKDGITAEPLGVTAVLECETSDFLDTSQ